LPIHAHPTKLRGQSRERELKNQRGGEKKRDRDEEENNLFKERSRMRRTVFSSRALPIAVNCHTHTVQNTLKGFEN